MSYLILVVDDEPLIREVLAMFLEDEGYRVVQAVDGQAALDLAAAQAPDVVVSDVRMPRLDGVELVRQLRARGLDVPVILVSAHYAGVDVPGVRFLGKPFDLDAIIIEIERGLTGRAV